MTELKTLKDIDLEIREEMKPLVLLPKEALHPNFERIRKEAIKWVNEMSMEEDSYNHTWSCCEFGGCHEAISWVIHFFNITEEELK